VNRTFDLGEKGSTLAGKTAGGMAPHKIRYTVVRDSQDERIKKQIQGML